MNKRKTRKLFQRTKTEPTLKVWWLFTCNLLAAIFVFFTLFFQVTLKSNHTVTYYLQTNVYFYVFTTNQILFLVNPFFITATVFVGLAVFSAIYFWIDYLFNHLYLLKLYKAAILFDNGYWNQFFAYICCFYIPLWVSLCPNVYDLNTHFSFFYHDLVINSSAITWNNSYTWTAGGIIYLVFYCLCTIYIEHITFYQIKKDDARKYIHGTMGKKKILVFGLTGSVGQNVLKVIDLFPDQYTLVGFTYFHNQSKALEIFESHLSVKEVFCPIDQEQSTVKSYEELIQKCHPDLIVNALCGIAGVEVSFLSITQKIPLALANKESLVAAGSLLMEQAQKNHVPIYPIDSEHATLWFLRQRFQKEEIKNYILTCSGGPFYHYEISEFMNLTYEQAIQHPTWKMGPKISIDSATLMNKAFELIEARWLFDTKNVFAIYHPQSKVHALIELKNHEIINAMSTPDMTLPIQLALSNFQSQDAIVENLLFNDLQLNFDYLDEQKFESLQIPKLYFDKYEKTTFGLIICTLDEIAIQLFKEKKLRFDEIVPFIFTNYQNFEIEPLRDLKQILNLQKQITERYLEQIKVV